MTSQSGISLKGGFSEISRACGMESVIQKALMDTPPGELVKLVQDFLGKTAWVTYMLMLLAPALWSACTIIMCTYELPLHFHFVQ